METATPRPKLRPNPVVATLKALVRTRISAGLLVVLPIYVTWLLIKVVFDLMRDASQWIVHGYLRSRFGESLLSTWHIDLREIEANLGHAPAPAELVAFLPLWLQWTIPLLCVLLTIILLYIIGLISANVFGARFFQFFETLLDRVPLVKTVYRAAKQIMSVFTSEQSTQMQRVAMVPFPDQSMRALAFITNSFKDSNTGEELCSVLVLTTPNPTTGYLQIVRRADITELDWSIDEAVRTIMSGGLLMPRALTMTSNRQRADMDREAAVHAAGRPGDSPRSGA